MSVLPVAPLHEETLGQSAQTPAERHASRPALKALPKVRRRQRGLMAGALLMLAAALAAVLGINIHVANSQYTVVQLQNEHRQLMHENQALTEQLHYRQSPQALSTAAVGLGMVAPASAGTFDLDSGEVVTTAEVAETGTTPTNFVEIPSGLAAEGGEAVDVSQQAADSPSGLLGLGALDTLTHPSSGDNDSAAEDSGSSARSGGGSIPGPQLRH
ncbi:hypothetical protein [Nesterenkonia alba]|uniref:hypothetical protein n=1 Tax=Nesterenkonia alba TaxID=515814 RepID=UPI0003B69841|nr:hypothetical protein [Nesterenkonia alba]